VADELKLDPDRLNVNGGAIAIGHPLAARAPGSPPRCCTSCAAAVRAGPRPACASVSARASPPYGKPAEHPVEPAGHGPGAGSAAVADPGDRVLTVPNAISVARLAGVPVFLWAGARPARGLVGGSPAHRRRGVRLARRQAGQGVEPAEPPGPGARPGGGPPVHRGDAGRAGDTRDHPVVAGGRAGAAGAGARRGPCSSSALLHQPAPGQLPGEGSTPCACSTPFPLLFLGSHDG